MPRAAADVAEANQCDRVGCGASPCRGRATKRGRVAGACRNRTYRGPYGPQLVLKTSRPPRPDPPPCTAAAEPGPHLRQGSCGVTPVTCLSDPAHPLWNTMPAAPPPLLVCATRALSA